MQELANYYTEERLTRLASILDGHLLSLRVLDFLVTNFSKKYKTCYVYKAKMVHLFVSYREQLLLYRRRYFDPFLRGKSQIRFKIGDDESPKEIATSIGQMNFFRWCFECGVVNFALKNIHQIRQDMDLTLLNARLLKKLTKKKRVKLNPNKYSCVLYST